jgi:hypothetical protein
LVATLLALPFLVGSSCAVLWTSDSSDKDDEEKEEKRFVVVTSGRLTDPVVTGLRYVSGSTSGITGESGEFAYEPGETVQFSMGDIALGAAVPPGPEMSIADLVEGDPESATAELNIRRLLRSLDRDPASETIAIPAAVRSAAVTSNEVVAPAIAYLDFSDHTAFGNSASQLVAVLTDAYPFTAVLVDADSLSPQPARSVDQ